MTAGIGAIALATPKLVVLFTIKLLPSGEVDCYKVRLCLDGSRMDREEMGGTFQAVSTMA